MLQSNSLEVVKGLRNLLLEGTKIDFTKWDKIKDKDNYSVSGAKIEFVSTTNVKDKINFEGIQNLSVKIVRASNNYFDFSNNSITKIKIIEKTNFLDVHFMRDKGSHLSPFFLLNQIEKDVKYAIFSNIKTDIAYPYVKVKEDENKCKYYEVYFPIIYQLKKNADEMEQIRDIIYAFFYYHKIKVIVQKAKYIVKDEKLKEKDSVLTVGLSPIIRFPGLVGLYKEDKCRLRYFSTKLTLKDVDEINKKFEANIPTEKVDMKFYGKNERDKMHEDDDKFEANVPTEKEDIKLNISNVLIFDSKSRQMKTFGACYLPFFDLLHHRIKISDDIYKIFNYISYFYEKGNKAIDSKEGTFGSIDKISASKVVSIVDAGQRNSIMDISNAIANVISPCFFYDGNPGSSLCSYCQGNEGPSILFFQFRTVDRDSILANANAIISSLYISDVVVFPVSFPPYSFLQSFEYAITRMKLLISDFSETDKILNNKKILYLQFPGSIKDNQAKYFTKQFEKLLENLDLFNMSIKEKKKDGKYYYFIGTKKIPEYFKFENTTKGGKSTNASPRDKKKLAKTPSNIKIKQVDIKQFVSALSAFSVINDYRKYMEMNIFFPTEGGDCSSIIFQNKDLQHNGNEDA